MIKKNGGIIFEEIVDTGKTSLDRLSEDEAADQLGIYDFRRSCKEVAFDDTYNCSIKALQNTKKQRCEASSAIKYLRLRLDKALGVALSGWC